MQFDLVTPEKLVVSYQAEQVIVPGSEGSFGAMAGHQPVISTLKPGAVRVIHEEGEDLYYVGYGFVDVSAEKVTVLAEEAASVSALKLAEVKASFTQVDEALKTLLKAGSSNLAEITSLSKKKVCLEAKLELIS